MLACRRVIGLGASSLTVRAASTQSSARPATVCPPEEYKGSQNFIAGKQGFAPGFPPPKKWRDAVKPKLPPMEPKDLPAPSQKQHSVPKNPKFANDALRQYRQKLRQRRYGYMHESLVNEERKREQRKESHLRSVEIVMDRRRKLIAEHNEYIEKVRSDPMSSENVLNVEGRTLVPHLHDKDDQIMQKQPRLHTLEPGYKLRPPSVSVVLPREANEQRSAERERNRSLSREQQHERRMQTLMALYHESESFVHYGNLNKMVLRCMGAMATSHQSLAEMTDSLNENGGIITGSEAARRSIEMRNALQGTAGRQGKIGLDGLLKWKKEKGGSGRLPEQE
ncbi:hypothetical protein EV175_000592 [Coemansia sp. RSA 1933]|nr:hypothetical protein EV175_000592 [Coemansia sp. RSA 1933]